MTQRRQIGFSLVELLITVAIILIIAAIAVPNLLRAKMAANEASASHSTREISTAEVGYHSAYPAVGYAPSLAALGGPAGSCNPDPATACLLDSLLTSGTRTGYRFFAAGFASAGSVLNTEYVASSAPTSFRQTGMRNFCIDTDGVLRAKLGGPGVPPAPDVPTCASYVAQ